MLMKILYIFLCVFIISRFIVSIRNDEKNTEIIASLVVYGGLIYFIVNIFKFIF